MHFYTTEEFFINKDALFKRILDGAIFIYPTDTIYGIGGNALLPAVAKRIREAKQRFDKPFSVIVPGTDWLKEHCTLTPKQKPWLAKLPGPYTLIVHIKKGTVPSVVNQGATTLGVRIPDHWFSHMVEELGIPIITTSTNIAGHDPMTSLEDIEESIKSKVDFIIYDGEKKGQPSTIIDTKGKVIQR